MTPNDLGKSFLVEESYKVTISGLLREYRIKLKEAILRSQFEMLNTKVRLTTSKTGNKGTRYWLVCPHCGRRVGVVYKHPLQGTFGCRKCLKLKYRQQRYKGMAESTLSR